MKKIIQHLKTGKTELLETPVPNISSNEILIRTKYSLVSIGTERMLVDFAKSNIINKVRQQPEKVKMVLDKVKTDGLMPTINAVKNKLDEPISLGYCNSGVVEEVGSDIIDIKVGDRVVSNGPHAEFVSVTRNLVAVIPDEVSSKDAAYTVLGSIGLQGVRLCNPTYGETVVVIGLGLIGILTAQILKSNGCNVIGVDIDKEKCKIASSYNIDTINPSDTDYISKVYKLTNNIGADGVIITAATKSNDVISQAAKISRKRGRVILVGVVGLDINRSDFYEKELTFQVSCSYGPGRYDPDFEEKGNDYPIGYVRWTERRNFECILESIAKNNIKFDKIPLEQVPFNDSQRLYDNLNSNKAMAYMLEYSSKPTKSSNIQLNERKFKKNRAVIGIIGSGGFTKSTILPLLEKTSCEIKSICSLNGLNSTLLAKKYNISNSTSNYKDIISDDEIDTVFITTRHDSHHKLVIEALENNKNIFVEKPLALNNIELNDIIKKYNNNQNSNITVGYNRRFSPHIIAIKKSIGVENDNLNIIATMNAGFIPEEHWVHDPEIGGGRIIGEACHLIDLCIYLTGSEVENVCMNALGNSPKKNTDNASLMLKFKNGATAVINYFSNGSKSYSKEKIEIFSNNKTWICDNFRKSKGFDDSHFRSMKSRIDKGHNNLLKSFIQRINEGGAELISFNDTINSTKTVFAAIESLTKGEWVEIK